MMVGELLNASDLDCQQGMFKLTMKSNAATYMAPPFDLNPLTKMRCLVTTFRVFSSSFLEYVKLTKLVMVQIFGNVEDEKCFSTLAFTKSKLQNRLTTHLPHVVHMFSQQFILCKISHMQIVLSNGEELTNSPLILL